MVENVPHGAQWISRRLELFPLRCVNSARYRSLVVSCPQCSHFKAHVIPLPYLHLSSSQSSHTLVVFDSCERQSALAYWGVALVDTFNPGSPALLNGVLDRGR